MTCAVMRTKQCSTISRQQIKKRHLFAVRTSHMTDCVVNEACAAAGKQRLNTIMSGDITRIYQTAEL